MKQHKASKDIVLSIMICILFFTANTLSYGEGHWAQDEIDYLLSKKIVSGYPDGTFKPDRPITRAEFIKIINRITNNKEKSTVPFKDVNEADWYYNDVAVAIKSGYIEGYGDNTFRPNNPITREEAAKILATVFRLQDGSIRNSAFVDQEEISPWAQEYVILLHNRGYVSGYGDGTFRPKAPITRAESVKMITNISGQIINTKGVYPKDVAKNLLVNTSDVVLKNIHIPGDLYLMEGVGDGDIVLDNVTIDGTLYIAGGGVDGISINNSRLNKVIVNRIDGLVNLVFDNSKSYLVVVHNNTELTAKKGTLIDHIEVMGKSRINIERAAEVGKIEIKSRDVELLVEGNISLIVADKDYKLNNRIIKEGRDLSIKDGRIVEPKKDEEYKPIEYIDHYDDHRDDKEDDEKPLPTDYKFIVKTDKDSYRLDEKIILTGIVSKGNVGLSNVDITLKLGDEPITVGQFKTDKNGEFTYTFMVPENTVPGEYELIIKANEPVNIVKKLNIRLLEIDEKHNIDVKPDKERYTIDEMITVTGEILEGETALYNVDITLKLQDEGGKGIISVAQLKTDENGSFSYSFRVPEDIKLGKYKLILKLNQPIDRFLEFPIELIEG